MTEPLSKEPLAVIVEDHAETADVFVKALESAGFTTTIIVDGRQALAELPALRPVLITLDLQLPYVSGEKVLEQIRGNVELARARIVLVTAEQQLASHLEDEVDLILLKPVPFDQLRELASRWHARLVG